MVLVLEVDAPGTDPAFRQGAVLVAIRLSEAVEVPALTRQHDGAQLAPREVLEEVAEELQALLRALPVVRGHVGIKCFFKTRAGRI